MLSLLHNNNHSVLLCYFRGVTIRQQQPISFSCQHVTDTWGVVLHMVALYVMGTCTFGVQPAKEGECVGCGFTDCGAVCDGDLYVWGTTSKGR